MNDFSYVCIDKTGKQRKGSMKAADEESVRSVLKGEGFIPVEIRPQSLLSKEIHVAIGSPVRLKDISLFCRQFASILSAGVPIIHALDILSQQTENQMFAKAIEEVQVLVEKGESLSGAMENRNKFFPSILRHMVAAGEASGNLEGVLERMAVHYEKEVKLRTQIKKAMIYPGIIALVALGVVILMLVAVIPNFIIMFQDMNIQMPFVTQMIINISNFIKRKWYLILLLTALILTGLHMYKNSPSGGRVFGEICLKLPVIGGLMIKSGSARFARTFGILLASGISVLDALDITLKTMDNVMIRQALLKAKADVAKGIALSVALKKSGIFPPMLYHMTKIGEESGNMEEMLEKLAEYYEEEVENMTASLSTVLEPLIICFMAVVVGILIMAILQPMLAMYNGLENL